MSPSLEVDSGAEDRDQNHPAQTLVGSEATMPRGVVALFRLNGGSRNERKSRKISLSFRFALD